MSQKDCFGTVHTAKLELTKALSDFHHSQIGQSGRTQVWIDPSQTKERLRRIYEMARRSFELLEIDDGERAQVALLTTDAEQVLGLVPHRPRY